MKAHKHLPVLRAALAAHQCKYVTQKLNTTLMPHSITHGDACFAYFNKSGAAGVKFEDLSLDQFKRIVDLAAGLLSSITNEKRGILAVEWVAG